jgi:uncharacterized protein
MKLEGLNLRSRWWSPYVVGALIGVLSWFAFASAGSLLGITTPFEYTAALTTKAVAPQAAAANPYYTNPEKNPKIGWEWMLVVGVFLGSAISSFLSEDRSQRRVPPLWASRFGRSSGKRYAGAFLGGAILMFGARVAQGCTSGHGISGALQFAVSSWIFVAVLFATAIGAALLIYGRGGAASDV